MLKNPDARVLLTNLSESLSNALRTKLRHLIHNEPRIAGRIEIHALNTIGWRLYESRFGAVQITTRDTFKDLLAKASPAVGGHKVSLQFLLTEWEQVVDAWQLESWEAYRDVARLGRKTRLPEKQRAVLWSIFKRVQVELSARNLMTHSGLFTRLAADLAQNGNLPFDFAVMDESQDVSVAQLRFLAALGAQRPNALFFSGDLGQRIFQQPFSWKTLGVDIRGRSSTLKSTTAHRIRSECKPTACWGLKYRTSTGILKSEEAPFRCSIARGRRFRY